MSVVFVFSGPSGVGKTTLVQNVLKELGSQIGISVSCTTRQPRTGEVDSVDYHFVSRDEFMKLIDNGEFVEHVQCYGNMYGTLRKSVHDILQVKSGCILDIEYDGAYNVLHNDFLKVKAVGILVIPPSIRRLRERLINRGSETEESLEVRWSSAFNPPKISRYDHVIINKRIDESTDELCSIIKNYI